MSRALGVLCCLLVVTGCDAPRLQAGFEQSLRPVAGCKSLYLVAADSEDSAQLVFLARDSPLAALRQGAAERVYDLASPTDPAIVYAQKGQALSAGFCDGAARPSVNTRYHATAGRARLTLDPTLQPEVLSLELSQVVLHEELGEHVLSLKEVRLDFPVTWAP